MSLWVVRSFSISIHLDSLGQLMNLMAFFVVFLREVAREQAIPFALY